MLHGIGHGRQFDSLLGGQSLRGEAVPQGPTDLRRELVVQPVNKVADVVGHVAEVEVLPPPVARVENLLEILAGCDDRLVVRQRAVPEVVDRWDVLVRLDDPPRQFGQLFLDPHVSGHSVDGRGGPEPRQTMPSSIGGPEGRN